MDILNPPEIKRPKKIGRQPKYTLDYYLMVAKQVAENGMSYREAARVYGMTHGSVYHWKKVYTSGRFPMMMKKVRDPSTETKIAHLEGRVRSLKQEIAELYLENKMLKKAIEYSQQIKSESSSVITSENLAQYQKGAK